MSRAPIVLFVYNRLQHTQQTIEALKANTLAKESNLYVFSDGPKHEKDKRDVEEIREYISSVNGFKKISIMNSPKNMGLANSVIAGVTRIVDIYGKAIGMEDDLITSKFFLKFINDALEFYESDQNIFSLTGFNLNTDLFKAPRSYPFDVYLNYRNCSWGWATWKDRWAKADWNIKSFSEFEKDKKSQRLFNRGGGDLTYLLKAQMGGRVDSWAIRWGYAHFMNNSYCLYPIKSYIDNIGHDKTGTHCGESSLFRNDVSSAKERVEFVHLEKIDLHMIRRYNKYFDLPLKFRLKEFVKKYFK